MFMYVRTDFMPLSYSLISLSYYLCLCPRLIMPLLLQSACGASHAEGHAAVSRRVARGATSLLNIRQIAMFIGTTKIIVIGK